jgi:hypothetical protein
MIRHVQNKTHVHVDVRVINRNNLGTTGEQPGNNGGTTGGNGEQRGEIGEQRGNHGV